MRRLRVLVSTLAMLVFCLPAMAGGRYILRPVDPASVTTVAGRHGLTVLGDVDDDQNKVYLVTASDMFQPSEVVSDCSSDADVADIEEDVDLSVPEIAASPLLNQSTTAILDQIASGRTLVSWYGQAVPGYYASQPALDVIRLKDAQTQLNASGRGMIVAVIDTGVDANHPVLKGAIISGYDFTRNLAGIPDEFADISPDAAAILNQSTTAILDNSNIATVNQSTTAILDQSTTAILDQSTTAILDSLPAAFGHGTMVAGVVRIAAPSAKIMPLKAFTAAGNARLSDILRAVYYAADHGADVINMSFSLSQSSLELVRAINYAQNRSAVAVASTGNTGLGQVSFPAAGPKVIGVASVDNTGVRSAFSSYGRGTWIAAPGEHVITTYPGGHYAAASGTSFSAPLISGSTALIKQFSPYSSFSNIAKFLACDRREPTPELGYGVANVYASIKWAADDD